jgi:hypothetical protein
MSLQYLIVQAQTLIISLITMTCRSRHISQTLPNSVIIFTSIWLNSTELIFLTRATYNSSKMVLVENLK